MSNALAKNVAEFSYSAMPETDLLKIIVVGAGPVGVRFIAELKKYPELQADIILFGDEPVEPYDRIKLTQLLAGKINYPDIFWSAAGAAAGASKDHHYICSRIQAIDTNRQQVTDAMGRSYPYDYLVLATGSNPHIPLIEGATLSGVYTFRNIRDTEQLLSRVSRSRHTIVAGGGLLGLEAAKGLLQHKTEVTLIHQGSRLMNRQLSEEPAELLLQRVTREGINVVVRDGLAKILGNERVESVVTRQGRRIPCDTVVLCTGIKPNINLAIAAGIKYNRGIVVDAELQTSAPNIFALGECTEFNNQIYGLVAPGLEQAAVLAANLAGKSARFVGSQPYTRLKVMDVAVNSFGEATDFVKRPKQQQLSFRNKKAELSRSVYFHKGKIIGACGVGHWPESQRVREAFLEQRYFFPWQRWLFRYTGKLWFFDERADPASWPAQAIICQCNRVSRGTIDQAVAQGCISVAAIGRSCGAGAVCGTCQPLVQAVLNHAVLNADEQYVALASADDVATTPLINSLLIASAVALTVCLLIWLLPGIAPPTSVQQFSLTWLWTDSFYKQVSGFSLLALTLIGLVLSLRKRLQWTFLGNFSRWRLLHTLLGVFGLAVLFAHTGAHLGENLNRWLMVNYLSAALLGAVLGIAIGIARNTHWQAALRKWSFWLHLLAVWPLPILVSAHVVSTYYF